MLTNFSLSDLIDYDCPIYANNSEHLIEQATFWLEGVGLSAVGVFGILGNLLSCLVLTRQELRNSFNLLLVALAFFDSCYIVGSLLETVRKSFKAASRLQLMVFPYVLYPGQMIALTGSVFMIVAIAFERYVSVHHPLDYNQAMNDPRCIRKRLLKYLIPVVLLSLTINIPKFFETEAFLIKTNLTEEEYFLFPGHEVHLNVTEMRVHPVYSSFVNWSQLFILGIIPVCLLVYFNTKIYQDIRERERRRRRRPQQHNNQANNNNCNGVHDGEEDGNVCGRAFGGVREWFVFFCKRLNLLRRDSNASEVSRSSSTENSCSPNRPTITTNAAAENAAATTTISSSNFEMSNARRRKVEDRLAVLFMGIVVFFLLCHFPRILLNFYEMMVIEKAMECSRSGRHAFAVWAQITTSVSHFLLVLNSSINILIYSLFNSQFRAAAKQLALDCTGRKRRENRRANNDLNDLMEPSQRSRAMNQRSTNSALVNFPHPRNENEELEMGHLLAAAAPVEGSKESGISCSAVLMVSNNGSVRSTSC